MVKKKMKKTSEISSLSDVVKCQNCHTEMKPGKKTHSRVMEWTEYTCPNCGCIWSEPKPLPGHEPVYITAKAVVIEETVDELIEEPIKESEDD